jgi:RNase P subunit RPR2
MSIVTCSDCGQRNRLPLNPNGKRIVCGRCHVTLVDVDDVDVDDDDDDDEEDEELS